MISDPPPIARGRLQYNPDLMPEMIRVVATLSSPRIAVRFARTFGGERVYFPSKLDDHHRLVRCLGRTVAARVCAKWVGESIPVPNATIYLRWIDAQALAALRLSRVDISKLMRLSQRHVHRLLEGVDADNIEIDATVLEIGRHYRVNRTKVHEAERAVRSLSSAQLDFGWPRMSHGAPIQVV